MATKIKTPMGELKYVFITGEGRNQAMPGEEARMQFVASLELTKNSAQLYWFGLCYIGLV